MNDFKHENEILEYKSKFVSELKKTFIAFANTGGGEVWIGIADNGEVVGVEDPDATVQQVVNCIRDNIRPDLVPFFQTEIKQKDGKFVVLVSLRRGTHRPYYLASKGVRPEGVFIRKGSETVSAHESEILNFIKSTSGNDFEDTCSLNQKLNFHYAEKFFEERDRNLGLAEQKTLGLIDDYNQFTNLALLFSDECPYQIKLARFAYNKTTGEEFIQSRLACSGSIFRQLSDASAWLEKENGLNAFFSGMERIDYRDFPVKAISQGLLNAVLHRDYSLNGPSLINLFPDRLEMISIGGLVQRMTEGDLLNGVSRPRNAKLASVFAKLKLAEGCGTGVRNIAASYKTNSRKPDFQIRANSFRLILPKWKCQNASGLGSDREMAFSSHAKAIQILLAEKGPLSRAQLQEEFGLSSSAVVKALAQLIDKKLVIKKRNGRVFVYSSLE